MKKVHDNVHKRYSYKTMLTIKTNLLKISRVSVLTRDKNWVMGCPKSLKTAPFDRSYTIYYYSAMVNIALSCKVFELFDVE